MKFGVVILGAGASRRMGRPKLLLPWKETTIIGHLIAQWNKIGADQIAIVLAEANVALTEELDRLGVSATNRIFNPEPDRGMFSSIQCAACSDVWEESITHFVITLGDQPHLKRETLQTLIEFVATDEARICQPSSNGRPKHPVVLPRAKFGELCGNENKTLAHFLQANESDRAFIEINDHGLSVDLDTPADYKEAIRKFDKPA